MKKTYSIYKVGGFDKEEFLNITFENKEDAEKFCELRSFEYGHYEIEENVCYESYEDYIVCNFKEHTKTLLNYILALEEQVKDMEEQYYNVVFSRDEKIFVSFNKIQEIVENGEKFLNTNIEVDDTKIKLTPYKYNKFVEAYNNLLKTLTENKTKIKKCKTEYINLWANEKNLKQTQKRKLQKNAPEEEQTL